jgi:hypothetical protein
MLRAYQEWEHTAVAITIDKLEDLYRYNVWRHAPYHYCLEVMLEVKISGVLNSSKYNRDLSTGKIIGYGKILLP